jgi:hypothetical protein
MVVPHAILPDLNTLDAESLRALLLETHERYCTTAQRLQSRESEIEHLKLLLGLSDISTNDSQHNQGLDPKQLGLRTQHAVHQRKLAEPDLHTGVI